MAPRLRPIAALAVLGVLFAPMRARAQPPSTEEKKQAAASFDAGVKKFDRAEFGEAARAFFEADRLAPSTVAITNAIAAARRAGDHLLVARAAERAIARGDALVQAREALADAGTRLARIELRCDPAPCKLSLDGVATAAAAEWVLPGTHAVHAEGGPGAAGDERLSCIAGATYQVVLHPRTPDAPPPREEPVRAPPPPPPPDPAPPLARGLPRGVFFAGLGATAVLGGVTVWSGVDAIAAKNALKSPTQAQEDDVRARARRTDYLLLGAGVAGVATAVIGIWFTGWRAGGAAAALVPAPGGATIAGRF